MASVLRFNILTILPSFLILSVISTITISPSKALLILSFGINTSFSNPESNINPNPFSLSCNFPFTKCVSLISFPDLYKYNKSYYLLP